MPLKGKESLKKRLHDRSDKLVRGVALEAHGRIIRRTPVDTGRARGNWNIGVNAIDRSVDGETKDSSRKKGGKTKRRASGAAQKSIQGGQGKILGDFQAGDRLFITNALPYVPDLEKGSSKQAPQGMVAVTKAEMKPLISRVLARIARG